MTDIIFLVFIFILAILYSSVGHGGASGYLALMAILGFAPEIMRSSSLSLNILVSAIAFYAFYKNGHFKFKLLLPFIITSMPFSFLGGIISINPNIYKIILGMFLLIAIVRLLTASKTPNSNKKSLRIWLAIIIGMFLGFFSGLIGIGGGIILSPLILLLCWANVKETSAVSAAFIFVNSVSGLGGMIVKGVAFDPAFVYMAIAGILGGLIGSRLGSYKLSYFHLRYVLAVVLLFASIKLIIL